MSVEETIAARAIEQGALFFMVIHRTGTVAERHAKLDDLISAIVEYKASFPLPVAGKSFGWRTAPDKPDVDETVLVQDCGEVTLGKLLRNGSWGMRRGGNWWEDLAAPYAWSYIPEVQ